MLASHLAEEVLTKSAVNPRLGRMLFDQALIAGLPTVEERISAHVDGIFCITIPSLCGEFDCCIIVVLLSGHTLKVTSSASVTWQFPRANVCLALSRAGVEEFFQFCNRFERINAQHQRCRIHLAFPAASF